MTAVDGASSRTLQRLGALAILAVGLAALWFLLLRPVAALLTEPYRHVEQLAAAVATYRAAAAARPQLESELAALRARAPSAHGLAQGANAALAAAQVQSDIRTIVERAAGRIHSTQNLAATADGSYERVALRYDLTVPMARLSELLRQIESHVPFYFIDQVQMQVPDRAGSGALDENAIVVQIRWTIVAYRWADGA